MRVLLLNQAFAPDVVSSGQHASDLAAHLAASGHDVTVVTARRAYDNPAVRFPAAQIWRGVRILRVAMTGFGKRARWRRALDFSSFLASCALRLAALPRFDVVLAMTSPPLISVLAALFVRLRGGRLLLWVMDLNPDEALAAGWLREGSLAACLLARLLRFSLHSSHTVVALDRFMRERLADKGVPKERIAVLAPWSHDASVRYDTDGRAAFRREHGLEDKFVVMYSGNHSPCHPLDTLLEAAQRLSARSDIVFCFVGGGSEFAKVGRFGRERGLLNVVCLPYQPLSRLSASLSAADLHVVVMGDQFVGIVHPCKIYNILALGIPVLYIGPASSHVTDLKPAGLLRASHGDAALAARLIAESAAARPQPSPAGESAEAFSARALLPRFQELIESTSDETMRKPKSASSLLAPVK